jgi:hypothetical protein
MTNHVGRRSLCDGRSTIQLNSEACHDYVRRMMAANAQTRPAEDLGEGALPHPITEILCCILEPISSHIAPNIRRNPCRNFCAISTLWPRLPGDETLDATVSNIMTTCFDVPKRLRQGAHCCRFNFQWPPCFFYGRPGYFEAGSVRGKSRWQHGADLGISPSPARPKADSQAMGSVLV